MFEEQVTVVGGTGDQVLGQLEEGVQQLSGQVVPGCQGSGRVNTNLSGLITGTTSNLFIKFYQDRWSSYRQAGG